MLLYTFIGCLLKHKIKFYFVLFILVNNQLDAQNFCFKIRLLHASTPIGVMIPEAV